MSHESPTRRPPGPLAIIGLGHIGLPLFLSFAEHSARDVLGVDRDHALLDALRQRRRSPRVDEEFHAPLAALAERRALRLAERPNKPCEAVIVAVESLSVEALIGVLDEVTPHLVPGGLLVLATTCQPAWFGQVRDHLHAAHGREPGESILLAHAPERLMPGRALREVCALPRVIGGHSEACVASAMALYNTIAKGAITQAGLEEAALVKIAENAYRAVNIVLANEIESIAHRHGLDASRVIAQANTHPRVDVHTPGAGAWGRCLPLAMELMASEGSELADMAHTLNEDRPRQIALRLMEDLRRRGIAPSLATVRVRGLAYKPGQRDFRRAAGALVVEHLLALGVREVQVCDPLVDLDTWRTAHSALFGTGRVRCVEATVKGRHDADAVVDIFEQA